MTKHTLEKTVAIERVRRVAVPASVLHAQEAELLGYLGGGHGCVRERGREGEEEGESERSKDERNVRASRAKTRW